MPTADGEEAVLLPMAVATEVEETPGALRYQVLQTAPTTLAVRLETDPGTDRAEVWQRVRTRLDELLWAHEVAAVGVELAAEAPQPNPRSGKLRHVLGLPPQLL